jgi:tocopherol O-methyltransferase
MEMISTRAIRAHYDRLSFFYRTFWGEHIHHGFWDNGESPRQAQLNLVKELAHRAHIKRGGNVLDVGCGFGASAIWLAQELHCSVAGITISPVQKRMAERSARYLELNHRVRFEVADANKLRFPAASFDAVWVIECSEHLFDKRQFIRQCGRLLRSGGVLALSSWLSGAAGRHNHQLISEICSGMLCPSRYFCRVSKLDDRKRISGCLRETNYQPSSQNMAGLRGDSRASNRAHLLAAAGAADPRIHTAV